MHLLCLTSWLQRWPSHIGFVFVFSHCFLLRALWAGLEPNSLPILLIIDRKHQSAIIESSKCFTWITNCSSNMILNDQLHFPLVAAVWISIREILIIIFTVSIIAIIADIFFFFMIADLCFLSLLFKLELLKCIFFIFSFQLK